jgi:hypothetical protein
VKHIILIILEILHGDDTFWYAVLPS